VAEDFVTALVLAFAIAAVSLTITKTKVSKPFRLWVKSRNAWAGELFSCPYCLSHWITWVAVAVYRPRLLHSGVAILDYFVSAMAIVAAVAMLVGAIALAMSYVPASE